MGFDKHERGVAQDDDGRVVSVKTDAHVVDPESDEAVQVTDVGPDNALGVHAEPSPEEAFEAAPDEEPDENDEPVE